MRYFTHGKSHLPGYPHHINPMAVPQSACYDWLKRPESARCLEDRWQGEKVKKIHEKSREIYGARRICQEMVKDGERISRTRTGHLMKQQGLESKSKRKFKATTNSNHGRPVAPNLLNREFLVDQPNAVYIGDIAYIPTDEGGRGYSCSRSRL
ncbi:IS3 family transposase [Thiolapillus sp.]